MGAFLGLWFGLGALMVAWAVVEPEPPAWRPAERGPWSRLRQLLASAEVGLGPWSLLGCCAAVALLVGMVALGIGRSMTVAAAFAVLGGSSPFAWVRARALRRREERDDAWPEVVDDLVSAVRAGLALPEALAQLATRGPAVLRPAFAEFAADYRARGRFVESLDRLKERLADPVADRVVEAIRVAREVGGSDLGGLLRALSELLREDLRTRGELRSRQAWTVNGARLAVAAPWLLLAVLSPRPQAIAADDSSAGAVVLLVGGSVSMLAYRLMLRIGRLPAEPRVLA